MNRRVIATIGAVAIAISLTGCSVLSDLGIGAPGGLGLSLPGAPPEAWRALTECVPVTEIEAVMHADVDFENERDSPELGCHYGNLDSGAAALVFMQGTSITYMPFSLRQDVTPVPAPDLGLGAFVVYDPELEGCSAFAPLARAESATFQSIVSTVFLPKASEDETCATAIAVLKVAAVPSAFMVPPDVPAASCDDANPDYTDTHFGGNHDAYVEFLSQECGLQGE